MTNNYGIPELFVKAIESHESGFTKTDKRYSVTELLQPTNIIQLSRKYPNIEEDVRDNVISLLGTAFHSYMEQFGNNAEQKVEYELDNGYTICGVIDDINELTHTITDYKTVSTSKVTNQDFNDNELQIKIYAYLVYHKFGILITKGKLYYLCKDWKKVVSIKNENYPSSPIYEHNFDINTADLLEVEHYLINKINDIETNTDYCNETERWNDGDKFAVYKDENSKRAVKVFVSREDAEQLVNEKGGIIKIQKGDDLRCDVYCKYRSVCGKFK